MAELHTGRTSVQLQRSPYREDLCRSAPFELVRADDDSDGDGLTIDGYGAVFNSVTTIDSWEGSFDETIAPGAFRKSIREGTPRMQFDHGHHPLLGSLPLGRWDTVEEDARGLHVVGRLSDNWLMQPFRDAIRDGGVDGMSFRFSVVRDEWTDKDGKKVKDEDLAELLWYGSSERGPLLRTLKEVRVSEVGPVTWPAYTETSVGVRSRATVVDLGRLDLRTPTARAQLARAVALADRLAPAQDAPTDPDASAAPDVPPLEPRSTARTAGEHPPAGPPSTAAAAEEHSAPARPANPGERRDLIREEFREFTQRYLDARRHDIKKESA